MQEIIGGNGMFKYIELFAGIGGFRSALDSLGGKCVFASEIDSFATQSYKALYDGAPELHGDITKIDARDIPDHDVLVGGFPCQAFSVAGQRKGFDDTRGTLFFEIARIAKEKQSRLMLLENVKGLLSHDKGRTVEVMAQALNDIGYAIDFAVLNSKYYGVPQNRERIFIVAHRDVGHAEWDVKGTDVVAKAKKRIQALGIRTFNFDWPTDGKVTESCVSDFIGDDYRECTEKQITAVQNSTYNTRTFHDGDGLSPTLAARDWKDGGRFFTHRGKYVKSKSIVHFRLQGFSEEQHEKLVSAGISESQLYKQAGNAVTVSVIKAIGLNLLPYLQRRLRPNTKLRQRANIHRRIRPVRERSAKSDNNTVI